MLDLFIPQVDQNKLHHNFIEITKDPQPYARELLNSWTDGFVDRDNKFVKEFQTTFNSSFWELYLFNVFKQYGFEIDFSKAYPDFIITNPYKICIEAVISNHAYNASPEYERDINPNNIPNIEMIVHTATVRLANAIISKYRDKYLKTYSKEDYVKGKPFILAVAPFEQPYFWEQTSQAIMHVLYGLKGFEYTDPNNKILPNVKRSIMDPFIEKDNGSEIPLGFFSNNQMEEISAIIFSNVATFGKIRALTKDKDPREMIFSFAKYHEKGFRPIQGSLPKKYYSEKLDSGLAIYLNPFAKYSLSENFLNHFPTVCSFDYSCNLPIGDSKNEELLKRMVNVINII